MKPVISNARVKILLIRVKYFDEFFRLVQIKIDGKWLNVWIPWLFVHFYSTEYITQ